MQICVEIHVTCLPPAWGMRLFQILAVLHSVAAVTIACRMEVYARWVRSLVVLKAMFLHRSHSLTSLVIESKAAAGDVVRYELTIAEY